MTSIVRFLRTYPVPVATLVAIAAGFAAGFGENGEFWRNATWTAGLVLCGAPLVFRTLAGMLRGRFAADVVATLAILASFALGQPVVGLVIVLMQSGGEALEGLAEGRATDALRALQEGAPTQVNRVRDGVVETVNADVVGVDEIILIRPGEVIACDAEVITGRSHIDTSRITGEPIPVSVTVGSSVMSGTVNAEGPLMVRVTAVAAESQYARIVRLVRQAQASKSPLQRVADRYAVWFTPVTLVVCGAAYGISGDWDRVLAVLAVATPCPLILATPVAVLGGLNRAARRNVLIRTGGALEALGSVDSVVFDKTGTITIGRPKVSRLVTAGIADERALLRIAAGVEHLSGHLLARPVVEAAAEAGIPIPDAAGVTESGGAGAEGQVEGSHVLIGSRSFVLERFPDTLPAIRQLDGKDGAAALRAYVIVNGELAGAVDYADLIRPGMRAMVDDLSAAGVDRVLLLSGDREENVKAVADAVGITIARGDLLPSDKVDTVRQLIGEGRSVLMMGDGTNDAPALSAATVGVALASQGRGIATESAGVILLADEPARVVDVILISRRTMRIARQSIRVGLGLSAIGMIAAAGGLLAPAAGAIMQEVIDLAVIVNALRAARPGRVREMPSELPPRPDRITHGETVEFKTTGVIPDGVRRPEEVLR
ncbi:MAG TPA: heavy metal translocating P-type ATPase [Thermoanaerobaculia bacterium]|nr:heavy metal translocating P-type ATPase [Thermoanaerobaculia bacterium]